MGNRKIVQLGLVGVGNFGPILAEGVKRSKKAELVTCFDILPEKRQAGSEKYGCAQEETYEAMLRRDDLDGVLLVTPNAIHCEQTELAAKYGKHVYVEKPIANTLADGRKMIAVCEKAGVVLMVGHIMRRFAGFRKIKELMAGGTIGNPIQVESNFSHNVGFALNPESFRWRGDDSGCPGGALMTLGVHHADTLKYLFGPITTVFSYFNKLYIPAPVEDVTATIFKFESGVLGYLGSNYAAPRTRWMHIYGTEANLVCTISRPDLPREESRIHYPLVDRYTRLQIFAKGKTELMDISLTEGDPVLEEIDEFAHCILTGDRPETDGRESLSALALIRAAIDSARLRKPVKIEV
jgi:predicted dehydrogenase